MTHNVIQQLEAYGEYADAVAPAISTDEFDLRSAEPVPARTPQRRTFPNWVVAVGAAAAVFILIGGVLWLLGGSGSGVVDEPMPVTTTMAVNPTTIAPSPPVIGPDKWDPILASTKAKAAPPAATCPEGSDPDDAGPVGQDRPDPGFVPGLGAAFDQRAGRIVYVSASGETWTFDVCTNVWHRMNPSGTRLDPSGAEEAGLVYDVDSDVTVSLGSRTWVYDAKTNTWTDRGPAPHTGQGPTGAVYDTVSGLIITTNIIWGSEPVWEMWAYDVDTDVWSRVAAVPLVRFDDADGPGSFTYLLPYAHDFLGFSQELDRFIFVGSYDMTVLADPRTGDATEIPTQSWWIDLGWQHGIYGQADDTVYVTTETTRICGFDTDLLTWTSCFGLPEGFRYSAYGAMVGDPINNRLVLVNGVYGNSWESATDDIWAVDLTTGEWTQILAPATDTTLATTTTATTSTTIAPTTTVAAATTIPVEPFDFAMQSLCDWFSPEQIDAIVTSTYEELGVLLNPWGEMDQREGQNSDCYWAEPVVTLSERHEPVDWAGTTFAQHPALNDSVVVSIHEPGFYGMMTGLDALLRIDGHSEPLWFGHTTPESVSGDVETIATLGLSIANKMLKEMGWIE